MRFCSLLVFALAAVLPAAAGPAVPYRAGDWPIEVSVEPDQPAIMLGEPTWLSFRIRNLSDVPLQIMVGGDYRNALGRPDSFKVRTVGRDGQVVPQPESSFSMGGMFGPQDLPAKGDYVSRLFLPHWATFTETGIYTVTCQRKLQLLKPGDRNESSKTTTIDVETEASTTLEVLPRDSDRMAAVIARLAATMFEPNPDRAEPAARTLAAIDDPRVVPHFRRALDSKSRGLKHVALTTLAKFNSDEALAGLKAGMATTAASFDEGNQSEQLAGNVRFAAAVGLSRSPHPQARPFLLTQRRDTSPGVRMTILHLLGAMPAAEALPLLREMADDPDPRIREEAKRYIDQASAGKKG